MSADPKSAKRHLRLDSLFALRVNMLVKSTPGVDFTNVFHARYFQNVTRKKTFVWKTRAKNASKNVGEIDPRKEFIVQIFYFLFFFREFLALQIKMQSTISGFPSLQILIFLIEKKVDGLLLKTWFSKECTSIYHDNAWIIDYVVQQWFSTFFYKRTTNKCFVFDFNQNDKNCLFNGIFGYNKVH